MFSKIRKALRKQDGFTLIELMTVLIILGVILGIGVPKYVQVQKQAKYDADLRTLENIIRAAETYAASINDYTTAMTFATLKGKGIIDDSDLNNAKWSDISSTSITFDASTGRVSDPSVILGLAGTNPKDD